MADVTLTAELRANVGAFEQNMSRAATTVTRASNQIDTGVTRANRAIAGVNPASNSAAFALTNLGRVAQDAPFGFIGIQNNLNPLLESFQRLRAESTSSGSALRALGSSLIGVGGLGLALSLVTSAVTIFTMWQQKSAKATKEVKKEQDDYVETLNAARSAELKGAKNGQEEVTRLQILYHATQDATLSIKDRNLAYDELADKYPKFFANADREKTVLGQNSLAYNTLRSSILAAAMAKAYESKIGEESNKMFEDEQRLLDLVNARVRTRTELEKAQAVIAANRARLLKGGGGGAQGAAGGSAQQLNAVTEAQTKLATIEGFINRKLDEQAKRRAIIDDLATRASTAEQAAGFKTGTQLDDQIKKLKEVKKEREFLAGRFVTKTPLSFTAPLTVGTSEEDLAAMTATVQALKDLSEAQALANYQADENTKLIKRQQDGYQYLTNVIGGGLIDAFSSALSGTQSFVSSMGQFLGQLITKLVAAALAAAALAALLTFTGIGGLLGISGGFSSNFGTAFSALSGLPKLAAGGITNGPTLAMIGEGREREVVAPLSKFDAMVDSRASQQGGGELSMTLKGSDLVLWLNRANKQNNRKS